MWGGGGGGYSEVIAVIRTILRTGVDSLVMGGVVCGVWWQMWLSVSIKTGLTSRCYHTVNGQNSIQIILRVEQFLPSALSPQHWTNSCNSLSSACQPLLISAVRTDLTENQSEHLASDRDVYGGEVCGGTYDMICWYHCYCLYLASLSSHMVSALCPVIQL